MRALGLVGGALLLSSLAWAGEPNLGIDSGGWLVVRELPSILDHNEVQDHLQSGLTTTLAFQIVSTSRESVLKGGARVDIRYELWDEVYLTSRYTLDRGAERKELASVSELRQWWSALNLRVIQVAPQTLSPREEFRLSLQVVPFSKAEQMDTQRWFSESVHRGSSETKERGGITGRRSDPLERVFSLLIATSIQRRPLVSFDWIVSLPEPP